MHKPKYITQVCFLSIFRHTNFYDILQKVSKIPQMAKFKTQVEKWWLHLTVFTMKVKTLIDAVESGLVLKNGLNSITQW